MNYTGEIITSRQNPLVKFLVSLQDKKGRDQARSFFVEGVKLSDWPDYGKIAEAYGLTYNECASNDELDDKLDWFLEGEGARILVCDVDSENNVK